MAEKTASDEAVIEAVERLGSNRKAAIELKLNARTVDKRMMRLRFRGYSPKHDMKHVVPEGYVVKGTSTFYDEFGKPRLQWVKSRLDEELRQSLLDTAMAALCEDIKREKPKPGPKVTGVREDLVNLYVVTDYHLGMLSWGEETGDDWDTQIAEDLLVAWFEAAIARSPNAQTGVFAQLGDFLHWDGMDAVTPASKHLLDADTRFQKLVRVVIRVLRRVINMLLAKHELVHLIMAEGNHDPASSIWLRELLTALYDCEPRITVDQSPDPYYAYEYGKTLLLFHHGHKRKPAQIDTVLVSKFKEKFGRSDYVYAHMGHMHHIDARETNLMVVEQHRTLAASDAYASRGGWMSGRDAKVITYSKQFGKVGEVVVSSRMLEVA